LQPDESSIGFATAISRTALRGCLIRGADGQRATMEVTGATPAAQYAGADALLVAP
jgi:hypothetical protein